MAHSPLILDPPARRRDPNRGRAVTAFVHDRRFARARAHVSVSLAPGAHTFTSFGREIEILLSPKNVLFAHLGAGRVHFVELSVDLTLHSRSCATIIASSSNRLAGEDVALIRRASASR